MFTTHQSQQCEASTSEQHQARQASRDDTSKLRSIYRRTFFCLFLLDMEPVREVGVSCAWALASTEPEAV